MDINHINNHKTTPVRVDERTAAQRTHADVTEARAQQTDSVELSPGATRLDRLGSQIRQADEVDHAHVAAIKEAIAEGRYHVDPERLAAKILELENDL